MAKCPTAKSLTAKKLALERTKVNSNDVSVKETNLPDFETRFRVKKKFLRRKLNISKISIMINSFTKKRCKAALC